MHPDMRTITANLASAYTGQGTDERGRTPGVASHGDASRNAGA